METDLLFLHDAYLTNTTATVVDVADGAVALDRTVLYPTGGGQPHDTGNLVSDGAALAVTAVKKNGATVWHTVDGDPPTVGPRWR